MQSRNLLQRNIKLIKNKRGSWFLIRDIILKLTKKYGTYDPFELADALKISVIYEELGSIKGYYHDKRMNE